MLTLLHAHDPGSVLQQCGDALTAAASRGVPGAREAAAECAAVLRERDWPGDEVLAGQLDTGARGTARVMRPLPVDLEGLSGLLERRPGLGRWPHRPEHRRVLARCR